MLKFRIPNILQRNYCYAFSLHRYLPISSFICKQNRHGGKYQQNKAFKYSYFLAFPIGITMSVIYCKRKFKINFNPIFDRFKAAISLVHAADFLSKNETAKEVPPRIRFNFLADVVEKTAPSVVYIEMVARHPVTQEKIPISNGSGFIIKSDGLILTNAHVVSHHGRVIVKLYNGQEFEGTVENFDTENDLATVRIKANSLPVLPLGKSSNLRAGEFVIAMGNPLTLSHTITAGVVSSANRQGKDLGLHRKSDYIQTDAAVNVGNSGGPLVNLDCEAIGINTMKITEGISFAVPSDRALEFLKRTEELNKIVDNRTKLNRPAGTKKKQKYLGITMLTLLPHLIKELQERNPDFPNVDHGVMIWKVMVNSPSHGCDLKHGDIITAINGKEVSQASDIYALLQSEDVLHIHINRKNKEFDVTVKLMDPVLH